MLKTTRSPTWNARSTEQLEFSIPDENSVRYPGWRVAAASSACVLVSFAALLVYTFPIFLKPVSAEFGWSREAVSFAFGIAALGVAACSPPLGWLLDRYPARRVIFPASLFSVARSRRLLC